MSATCLRLVVGLGNPGYKYENTRHNLGYMVVDRLLEKCQAVSRKISSRRDSELWTIRKMGHQIILQKPATYMNQSGPVIAELSAIEKILPSETLIIYDDLDLPLGKIRLRPSGSSGGHRGLDSIILALNTKDFNRLRIGIGSVEDRQKTVDFVLSKFLPKEQPIVDRVLDVCVDCILLSIKNGVEVSMNKYNGIQLT